VGVNSKESIQVAPFVQIEQFPAATDRGIVDQDFRNPLPLTALLHFCCLKVVIGDIMLDEVQAFDTQQLFGPLTISTVIPGIDLDFNAHASACPVRVSLLRFKTTQGEARCKLQKGKSCDF
jgi:hypothetical protein